MLARYRLAPSGFTSPWEASEDLSCSSKKPATLRDRLSQVETDRAFGSHTQPVTHLPPFPQTFFFRSGIIRSSSSFVLTGRRLVPPPRETHSDHLLSGGMTVGYHDPSTGSQ